MKKTIISTILIMIFSCTLMPIENEQEILQEFIKTKNEFIIALKNDDINNIDRFYIKGFRNNHIFNKIKKLDLSNIDIYIGNIEVKSNNKISTLAIINIGISSAYFDVIWLNDNGQWKISTIYER